MSYEVEFTDTAKRQLKKLDKNTQTRIINALTRIRVRPHVFVKKIVGDDGYRLRVGDYRVILDIDQGKLIILILKVGHRKNIYKLT